MTVTVDPTILEALEAAPVPYDFFREVHKGLRKALFDLVVRVGATDFTDGPARDVAVDAVHATIGLLQFHHGHEDRFVKPLLERFDSRLAVLVDEGHAETDAALAEIELVADALGGADGAETTRLGLELYLRAALFAATYLAHMALEEGAVMARLREAMSLAELFEVDMALRASIAPENLCRFVTIMVPAMNPEERTAMLGGLRAGAPAEVFEQVRSTAQAALDPVDYAVVAARLALDS